ncbi:MAG: triose-phosphate isomerase [Candidatus Cloacimonetes bacterium]|nr:triose-phosphate isomerase [Candidatus Cloacimonadota bacterium]MCF7814821.1 triose-phosphate isomerase [Candidatus Cloacimonadota bacterium]MCF7867649.1 triose-phosphate isomerase [Candidatus Cloacimonadota bacterium]MCF7883553.1 triose-phosphate isomerase [Candidatus Cloacimonadota bacterium]
MRNILIAGNWKMNKTFEEAEDFLVELNDKLKDMQLTKTEVAICAPYVYLEMAYDLALDSPLLIGAQNCSEHDNGAYTGEISAKMLSSMEMDYCIVGHSERRQYFAETDEMVNLKIKKLLLDGIDPIVCIGETLEQREEGITKDLILKQLSGAFQDIDFEERNIVIAYEPIWAIGTGKTATPQQAQEIHALIRNWLTDTYGEDISEFTQILYGGSMKPENVEELLKQVDIDGGLIGGASLDISKFSSMIDVAVSL